MGNVCSATESRSTRSAKKSSTKKQRKKPVEVKRAKKASKGQEQPISVVPAADQGQEQQRDAKARNPLLEESRSVLSSITGSDRKSSVSQLQQKNSDSSTANLPPASPIAPPTRAGKDFEPLSAAKLSLVRCWIDVIEKKALLDPQDVAGYQRLSSKTSSFSARRGSILESVAKAQIEPDQAPAGGSLRVEQNPSRSSEK